MLGDEQRQNGKLLAGAHVWLRLSPPSVISAGERISTIESHASMSTLQGLAALFPFWFYDGACIQRTSAFCCSSYAPIQQVRPIHARDPREANDRRRKHLLKLVSAIDDHAVPNFGAEIRLKHRLPCAVAAEEHSAKYRQRDRAGRPLCSGI
ncbi:hypothetical protein GWG65_30230 [Bradyrhizobium sp. CSA207]|uniref:hypothetical protein n=1 Tax=Bradyrhizobium sp. CSA207 TaxID=2698826 RepID=UPI0023B0E0B6|nr:hypothetical protein [Bradyrhizobium sp. CSA207]MDE5445613.1 hypothetical protein [Bradyrhizobium sp. CSA207]